MPSVDNLFNRCHSFLSLFWVQPLLNLPFKSGLGDYRRTGLSSRSGFPTHFQEEEALLSEMDVTGQAFEDMQEQNIRLMQQLREKDDANFKLMSERIKSNQIHKLLKEEKEELADQVLTLKTQVINWIMGDGAAESKPATFLTQGMH